MFLKDIKIGGIYCHRDFTRPVKVKVDSVEPSIDHRGRRVMCTVVSSGKKMECYHGNLTPWKEHLIQQKEARLYEKRMSEKIEALAEEVGCDSEGSYDDYTATATLRLSEEGAERLLGLCAAKPIPAERRPSLAQDPWEWSNNCDLLSRRVRRAIGCGHSGYDSPNELHQASIDFAMEDQLDEAMKKIGVGEDTSSNLGELLV